MYVKIEKSGCCERKGMVQVRYSFYLEDGDYGYERQLVDGQATPFHNHFSYFHPNVSLPKIEAKGEELLIEAYRYWKRDEFPNLINPKIEYPPVVTDERRMACLNKVNEIHAKDK